MTEPQWMTPDQAAEHLCLSRATVYRMMQAAEYSDPDKAPPHCRQFVGIGFPRPIRLSERITRLDRAAVKAWASGHYSGHYDGSGGIGESA